MKTYKELEPGRLHYDGHLYLSGYTCLVSLPDGLSVEGCLYLRGCTSLVSLGHGLSVGLSLYLSGCTALVSLPPDLRVGGDLGLDGCTSLVSLGHGLSVEDTIRLEGTPYWDACAVRGCGREGRSIYAVPDGRIKIGCFFGPRAYAEARIRAEYEGDAQAQYLAQVAEAYEKCAAHVAKQ